MAFSSPTRPKDCIDVAHEVFLPLGRWMERYDKWSKTSVSEGLMGERREESLQLYQEGLALSQAMLKYTELHRHSKDLYGFLEKIEREFGFVRIQMPPVQQRSLLRP